MGAQGLVAVGVPPQPLWLLYVKIVILVLSLIVLALAAYALSLTGDWYGGHPGGMDIFIAILSFIVYGGALSLELWAAQHFYRIGALIGYIFSIIFWLSAWAWSATWASVFLSPGGSRADNSFGGALAGCAALGAVVWVLTIVHLAFFIRACVVDTTVAGQAELGQMKAGEAPPQQYQQQYQPVQQPYPAQQQQPYGAQPYPAQPNPAEQYPAQQYPAQQPYGEQPYPTQ
ncbi:hypothetical protein C8A03DRAFT_17280 [Achaetomium macrosporum]|uniref:MARVEL domain-containing protein n=1 Tax=Achaetomium macrosporum TaxID=79813 RepID=A0AAN7C770_9PEZI|nr:hypothetical protein C8A03DRAFT_17280 [Achaetomium macrosporum]